MIDQCNGILIPLAFQAAFSSLGADRLKSCATFGSGGSWPRFFVFDILGAACWVGLICSIGYFFGDRLSWLIHLMGRTGLILLASAVIVVAFWVLVHKYERVKGWT